MNVNVNMSTEASPRRRSSSPPPPHRANSCRRIWIGRGGGVVGVSVDEFSIRQTRTQFVVFANITPLSVM